MGRNATAISATIGKEEGLPEDDAHSSVDPAVSAAQRDKYMDVSNVCYASALSS